MPAPVGIWSPLDLRASKKKGQWILINELLFSHPTCGERAVNKGFVTDLASIPRFFRRVFTVNGTHRRAAVVHDYLYAIGGKFEKFTLTRKECDQIFDDLMGYERVCEFKRKPMMAAVRMFGWSSFKGDQ